MPHIVFYNTKLNKQKKSHSEAKCKQKFGRNPKCDRDWIKVQRKKGNKKEIKVQREKGNKSPNREGK